MTINLQWRHLPLAVLWTLITLISACGGGSNPEPTAEDTLYFVHTDNLGTPQVITDGNQNTVWEGRALPFGETDIITNEIAFNVRFPGQYYDQETGLHYNYFRDYDPGLGRYIQSDPIGLQGGLNTFAYVGGNPLKYIDPFGLNTEKLWIMREAGRTAQTFAQGNKIRKIKQLCEKWGGKPSEWKKRKGWDPYGNEYHWYERAGKKYGWKKAGESDPF